MKFIFTLLFLLTGSIAMSQVYSATDSVMLSTTNSSGFGNNSRGFEFIPNTNITITELGHRLPGQNGTYTWVIWETGTQMQVHQQVSTLPNVPGVWQYEPISSPVSLSAGVSYTLSLYQAGSSAPYYYEPSTQINSNLTYVTMRYCNSCGPTTFPTSTLANYHYGTPDFHFVICTAPTYSTISELACNSYTSPSGNYTWTSSGTYYDTIPNSQGCDSIMTINLTVDYSPVMNITAGSCNSYTAPSGQVFTSTGVFYDTIQNGASCDSIFIINLTVQSSSTSNITEIACDSYTSPSGNYVWTSTGTYMDTIPNSVGCDSVMTIDLTVGYSSASSITEVVCDSYTSPGGQLLTSSGTYYDTLSNAMGCDSIVTINLTVNQSNSSTQTESAIDQYTWPVNNQTYTTSGTYVDTIQTAAGCDSIVTLNLTVQYTGLDEEGKSLITLHPNPASEYVNVIIPEELVGNEYAIYDANGKEIMNGTFSKTESKLELGSLPTGVYMLQVDGLVRQDFRIVKE